MPVARYASRRRRSSLAHTHFKTAIKYRTPKNVTFAPNVTPATYESTTDGVAVDAGVQPKLFPPSAAPRGPPKKKQPKNRRRSQGYIPRPPNAFMLFRADFVKQKHVPGSIEPSHTNLSKIIGITWKSLPEEEKQVWQNLAVKEAAAHRAMYPNYKYQPRPPKRKRKAKVEESLDLESEQHCEDVRQLLLEGLKGEELAQALAELKRTRSASGTPSTSVSTPTQGPTPAPSLPPASETSSIYLGGSPYIDGIPLAPAPVYIRRPSSVPLPGVFPFPTGLPPLPFPRMPSIDFNGGGPSSYIQPPRRPSSAQAAMFRTWAEPFEPLQSTSFAPLPEADIDFEQHYLDNSAFPGEVTWSFDGVPGVMPRGPDGSHIPPHEITISPLDAVPMHAEQAPAPAPQEWLDPLSLSMYDSSPAPAPTEIRPPELLVPIYAPKPQRAFDAGDAWGDAVKAPAPFIKNEEHVDPYGAGADVFAAYIDYGSTIGPDLGASTYTTSSHDMFAPSQMTYGTQTEYAPAQEAMFSEPIFA